MDVDLSIEEIKRLKVARVKCDRSLMFFTRYFMKKLKGDKFDVNWHHTDICDNLDKIKNYKLEHLSINIPPRHSKTELVLNFIAKSLGENPNANFLYITSSDELRSETSTRIRDIINDEHFQLMYGVQLKKDQKAKSLWRTEQGGGLKTATIGGQIIGFGAGQMRNIADLEDQIRTFEGCIVLDDINKADDAEQMNAANDAVIRRIANSVLSRRNSPDTPIINIQQRVGLKDATEFFLKYYKDSSKAKFLVYPVLYNGKPLWASIMPMEEIQRQKTDHRTKLMFEAQYMQNPKPREGLMYEALKRYSKVNGDVGMKIAYIDQADTGADHFAMAIADIRPREIYIIEAMYTLAPMKVALPRAMGLCEHHEVDLLLIEANRESTYSIAEMKKQVNFKVIPIPNNKNKMARINAQSPTVEEFCLFKENPEAGGEYDRFMESLEEMAQDSTNKDDAADCLSGLLKYVRYRNLIKAES